MKDPEWIYFGDLVVETGMRRGVLHREFYGSDRIERDGWIVERKPAEKKSVKYMYRIVQRGGETLHIGARQHSSLSCEVCGKALTKYRSVVVNSILHCIACNRKAFVDHCGKTRNRLKI